MAKYKLTKPFVGPANGHSTAQHFKASATIEVADDTPPAHSWIPLDDAARAAVEKHRRPFDILPNGVQVRYRATGRLTGGAGRPKNPGPVAALTPRHVTAADSVAERQRAFKGKPISETLADIETEPLRRAIERNR
jgi:hypothetical protein